MSTEMICVLEVKVVNVNRDTFMAMRFEAPPCSNQPSSEEYIEPKIVQELIQGQQFRARDGRTVCIGISKQVQDALGIPLAAFEDMSQRTSKQEREVMDLRRNLSYYETEYRKMKVDTWYRFGQAVREYMEMI